MELHSSSVKRAIQSEESELADIEQDLKSALRAYPTGVCVLTCRSAGGEDHGMTISSVASLSLEPPLILFSVRSESQRLPIWLDANELAINILSADQTEIAQRFSRPGPGDWNNVSFHRAISRAPLLNEAIGHLECRPFAVIPMGDHHLFSMQVIRASADPERAPLVFFRSDFTSVSGRGADKMRPMRDK